MIETTTLQKRIRDWVTSTFGPGPIDDKRERALRLVEEALELAQSMGLEQGKALALVGYVYGCEPGELRQELGGVMLTALAAAECLDLDAGNACELELARVESPETVAKCRRKQEEKKHRGLAGDSEQKGKLHGPIGEATKAAADQLWQQAQIASRRVVEMVPSELRLGLRVSYSFGAVDRFQEGPGRMMVKFEHADCDGWFVVFDSDLDDLEGMRTHVDECVGAWQEQKAEAAKKFDLAALDAAVETLRANEIPEPYFAITPRPLDLTDAVEKLAAREPPMFGERYPRPASPSGAPYDASRKHFLEVRYPGNGRDDCELPITFCSTKAVRELGEFLLTMANNADELGAVPAELRLQVALPEHHVAHVHQQLRDVLNELACSWASSALEKIPPKPDASLTDEGHRALLHGRRLGLVRAVHELVLRADLPEEHLEELKGL